MFGRRRKRQNILEQVIEERKKKQTTTLHSKQIKANNVFQQCAKQISRVSHEFDVDILGGRLHLVSTHKMFFALDNYIWTLPLLSVPNTNINIYIYIKLLLLYIFLNPLSTNTHLIYFKVGRINLRK